MRRLVPITRWLTACVLWLVLDIQAARAAGIEYRAQQDDIVVSVDARWPGCMNGGYYPIRIRVQNRGATRELRFAFEPNDTGMPLVERRMTSQQNATATFTLLVPLVGGQTYGTFRVRSAGAELKDLSRSFSIAEMDTNVTRPGLLLVADDLVDCSQFELAVSSVFRAGTSGYGPVASENHLVAAPAVLPNVPLAYSGLDVVAMRLKTLANLPGEARDAIINWTRTGGLLLVFEVGQAPEDSREMLESTGLARSSQSAPWQRPDPAKRVGVEIVQYEAHGAMSVSSTSNPEFAWPADRSAFSYRPCGLGYIAEFPGNPFPGSPHDWAWFMRSLESQGFVWRYGERLGINGRSENMDFMKFMIPGIESVPTYAFLFFITLFAILIGPVNYYFLARRNWNNFLIVTVPAVAFVTSILLFAYAVLSEGFTVKARTRSLTVLDQGTQSAVVASRLSLYAGLAPSDGLRFSPDTSIMPVWPLSTEFETGAVDWSDTQHLRYGWLRSRTKTQFCLLTPRAERGRLTFQSTSAENWGTTNGLEWDLDTLIVADEKGVLRFAKNVGAGSSAPLNLLTAEEATAFADSIDRASPAVPSALQNTSGQSIFHEIGQANRYHYRYGYGHQRADFSLANGLMERRIRELQTSVRDRSLPPRSYVAILKNSPGIELGTQATVVDGWHLLLGYY